MHQNQTDNNTKDHEPSRVIAILFSALTMALVIHWLSEKKKSFIVKSITVTVNSLSEVELLTDSPVKPILYSHVAGLDQLEGQKTKTTFISVMLPAVLVAKHNMREDSLKVVRLIGKRYWNKNDSAFYFELEERFKAKNIDNLLTRMGTLPNSIVLAQAAVETGWGQSRFFLEGNNVFGIWSYNPNEPRIQASSLRESTSIYVRAYDNISESVADYFRTLASARAYHNLRKARVTTNDPFELLPHLKYYSERRALYTNQLKSVIQQNDLTRYDNYQIDPRYLVRE